MQRNALGRAALAHVRISLLRGGRRRPGTLSRVVRTHGQPPLQGYNAQAAVNEQQIVLAAEITNSSTDFSRLDRMVTATPDELRAAGIDQPPEAVAADAGLSRCGRRGGGGD